MSLRERLQQRARPRVVWPLRIEDSSRVMGLQDAVEQAEQELRIATVAFSDGSAELAAARARVEAARAALVPCYEPVELVALAPPEFEKLAAEHPPGSGEEAWAKTFPRALFLACAPTELSTEEWEAVLDGELTQGEKIELLNTCLALNMRVPDPALPKGWTTMPS